MDQKIQNLIGVVVVIALLGGMAAGFWYVNSFAKTSAPQRSFQVQGEGKVVAVPDVAEINFGVLTEGGKDLSKLQKDNSDKVNSIIEFLKSNGIEAKDIKTSYYNISPRYQSFSCPVSIQGIMPLTEGVESQAFPLPSGTGESKGGEVYPDIRPCPPSAIIGYSINQSLVVKVRNLSKAGEVLSGVVDRGANNVYGPSFTIDDISVLQDQARAEAITKAKAKAEATAAAGGFKLGKLLSINEGYYMPQPFYSTEGFGGGMAMSKEATPPNIEPGSQDVTITVTLVYEIK